MNWIGLVVNLSIVIFAVYTIRTKEMCDSDRWIGWWLIAWCVTGIVLNVAALILGG